MKYSTFFILFLAIFIFLVPPVFAQATGNRKTKDVVVIKITKCRLYHYEENEKGERRLIREYIVATVKKGELPALGEGFITEKEFNPFWYPTKRTIDYFAEKKEIVLPKVVPPGDKNNYMGKFKLKLSHRTVKGDIYRIHGILESDKNLLGKRATGGCVRMDNEEGLDFARKIPIGTKVIFEM